MLPHLLYQLKTSTERLRVLAGDEAVAFIESYQATVTQYLIDRALAVAEYATVRLSGVDEVGKLTIRCFELEREHSVPAAFIAGEICDAMDRWRHVVDDGVAVRGLASTETSTDDIAGKRPAEEQPGRGTARRSRQARGRRARNARRAEARSGR